jgi:hypothetical protein
MGPSDWLRLCSAAVAQGDKIGKWEVENREIEKREKSLRLRVGGDF